MVFSAVKALRAVVLFKKATEPVKLKIVLVLGNIFDSLVLDHEILGAQT